MGEPIIELEELTKKYGKFTAVDHINLTVHKGEIFGILGPNGAGKSTTILMMLGLTDPTSGSVKVRDQFHPQPATSEAPRGLPAGRRGVLR